MLKVATWCAKCLFLYFLIVILALRYSWVYTAPVWQIANRMHWTSLNRLQFVLGYFPIIYAVVGFLIGLVPWGRLGDTIGDLLRAINPKFTLEHAVVPPILWAWLPVTLVFLTRFASWQSGSSSVFDAHRSHGRFERFFGPLAAQAPGLLDDRWISDRFIFTGPMLFLMSCAIACLIRYRLAPGQREPIRPVE